MHNGSNDYDDVHSVVTQHPKLQVSDPGKGTGSPIGTCRYIDMTEVVASMDVGESSDEAPLCYRRKTRLCWSAGSGRWSGGKSLRPKTSKPLFQGSYSSTLNPEASAPQAPSRRCWRRQRPSPHQHHRHRLRKDAPGSTPPHPTSGRLSEEYLKVLRVSRMFLF